jgi:phosphoglycolate phosphatase-like HAD superfamily hydrolase
MEHSKGIIALDGDGVLLDYNLAYAHAWERAFGVLPKLVDPNAYWPMDRYGVPHLNGSAMAKLQAARGYLFWSSMQAIDGALVACQALVDSGYELVCVTAIKSEFLEARKQNIRELGFPIERVIAAPRDGHGTVSPKAGALAELMPLAFVDDLAPYLRGIPQEIHAALILRDPNGSPNVGEALDLADSTHTNLAAFASWWITRQV